MLFFDVFPRVCIFDLPTSTVSGQDNIPVVDPYIITLFLRQNKVEHFVSWNSKGDKNVLESTELYKDEKGASQSIYSYMLAPPQLSIYKKFLNIEYSPIPKLDGDVKPFVIANYKVEMPLQDLKVDIKS